MAKNIRLDHEHTERALQQAICNTAQVVIEPPGHPNTTLNGLLITGDDEALLIELTGHPAIHVSELLGAECEAQIYSDQRYRLIATIVATPSWGETQAVAIRRPTEIQVVDRRRFFRARLAPSCTVRLTWGHNGEHQHHTVSLLNISPDGMACRIGDEVAPAIRHCRRLLASFELPGATNTFNIAANVSNITPASPGANILGLQFERTADHAEQLTALRELLQQPERITTEEHACV